MAPNKKQKKESSKEQTDKRVFCEEIMDSNPIKKRHPSCYMPIKIILKEEGCKEKSPFERQKALNLDKIEVELAKEEKRNQRSTVDLAIGIAGRKKGGDKKIRLVECKFDVKRFHRKLIEDLRDKNKQTRDYYSFGYPIQESFVVLLNEDFFQQGLRFIKNGFSDSPYCEVMTVKEFYSQYFEPY